MLFEINKKGSLGALEEDWVVVSILDNNSVYYLRFPDWNILSK